MSSLWSLPGPTILNREAFGKVTLCWRIPLPKLSLTYQFITDCLLLPTLFQNNFYQDFPDLSFNGVTLFSGLVLLNLCDELDLVHLFSGRYVFPCLCYSVFPVIFPTSGQSLTSFRSLCSLFNLFIIFFYFLELFCGSLFFLLHSPPWASFASFHTSFRPRLSVSLRHTLTTSSCTVC